MCGVINNIWDSFVDEFENHREEKFNRAHKVRVIRREGKIIRQDH